MRDLVMESKLLNRLFKEIRPGYIFIIGKKSFMKSKCGKAMDVRTGHIVEFEEDKEVELDLGARFLIGSMDE